MADDQPGLITERKGRELWLTLCRPAQANAIDPAVCLALSKALARPDADVVVLTGSGTRAFCAGVDLAAGPTDLSGTQLDLQRAETLWGCLQAILNSPVPVLCIMNGPALGAGAMIALLCDLVLSDMDAYLRFPEVQMGMPSVLGLEVVSALATQGIAAHWINTGRRVTAQEALDCKVIHATYSADTRSRLVEDSLKLLSGPSTAARNQNRRWINAARQRALQPAWRELQRYISSGASSSPGNQP